MPAAMPHTSNVLRSSAASGRWRASVAANQAAICTIGPSRPMEAPVPTDSNDERLRVSVVLPLGVCFLPAFVLTTIVPVVLTLAQRALAP